MTKAEAKACQKCEGCVYGKEYTPTDFDQYDDEEVYRILKGKKKFYHCLFPEDTCFFNEYQDMM